MKYLFAWKATLANQWQQKGQLIGRTVLFLMIVYLFHQIFRSVNAQANRLWYFGMAEAIILSTSPLVLQIAKDIRSNQIVYFLLRPVSYSLYRMAEAMGAAFFRYCFLIIIATGYLYFLQGYFPTDLKAFFLSFPIGLMGIFLYTQLSLLIGISSHWIKDIKTPLYFNLTATFCFGGLIMPIHFYPVWMQTICYITPYPWILWWPASLFSGSMSLFLFPVFGWLAWGLLLILFNILLFNKYKQSLVINGE